MKYYCEECGKELKELYERVHTKQVSDRMLCRVCNNEEVMQEEFGHEDLVLIEYLPCGCEAEDAYEITITEAIVELGSYVFRQMIENRYPSELAQDEEGLVILTWRPKQEERLNCRTVEQQMEYVAECQAGVREWDMY